jgi:phosphoglycolate phosphatase
MHEKDSIAYKAAMFDLDGTLMDTIADLTDAMNVALAACGFPMCSVAQCKYFVGDGVRNFVIRALPKDKRGDDEAIAKVSAIYRNAYAKCWAVKTRPYLGIPELLDGLTRRGLKMVVFSNKPDDFAKLMVAKLLPRWRFEEVVGAIEGKPQKPDPQVPLELAGKLGVPPAGFLYVGDTNTDMKTANAAGMFAVGALWGFRTAEELRANGAKVLIAHPTDLLKLL